MSQRANTSNPPTPPIELQRTGSGHQLDGENFETTADVNQARNGGNQQLAPVDGGIAAWRLLCVTFVFEALLWGFPLSFGVFQNYYAQQPQFRNNPYIPIVGSIASGISYLGAPLMTPIIKRFPAYHRHMIWAGWSTCIISLIAGSFATNLGTLIITQGVMYGFGFLALYYPIVSMVNEWWINRRGMAFGIIVSASGASGVVLPFAMEALLNKYGYQITLRAVAVALAILTGPLIPFLKGRLPIASSSIRAPTDWSFLNSPLFYVYFSATLAQGLGFFFPTLHLPSHAATLNLSSTFGALLLALMSVAQVLGQFAFGYLSDNRLPLVFLLVLSTSVAGVSALTLWGLSKSFPLLVVFSLVYGFFGAAFPAMRARMSSSLSQEPSAALATFNIFCFAQGIGNVLSGPISGGLLKDKVQLEMYGVGRYGLIVGFTGGFMILSSGFIVFWQLWPKKPSSA